MRLALLFVAAVIAVIAAVAVLQFSGNKQQQNAQNGQQVQTGSSFGNVTTVNVLVAKADIPAGTVLDETMVDKQPWPQHLVAEGFIVDGTEESKVIGQVARASFSAREPLMASKLAKPGDPSFIAGILPAGDRAVTLAVDAISGLAGYVLAGDKIDVLVTHNIPEQQAVRDNPQKNPGRYADKPGITEVLIANAPVLAVNVRPATVKQTNPNNTPSSITIQVGEQGAQLIRLAEKNGTLSVALRSVKDKDNMDSPAPTTTPVLTRVSMLESSGDYVKVVRGTGKSQQTTEMQESPAIAVPMAAPAIPANP